MEYLALYNDNDELLDEKIDCKFKNDVEAGKYFRIVIIFIENDNNQFLIQKVSDVKGNCFATTGGHVQYGNSSLETAVEEISEELNINISPNELELVKTHKYPKAYQDTYYLKKNININDIKLQEEEVSSVCWMSIEQINEKINNGEFRKGNIEPFKEVLRKLN